MKKEGVAQDVDNINTCGILILIQLQKRENKMLDTNKEEEKKARAHALAEGDKALATVCAKIVQMAVTATQGQLQSALYLSCRGADDDLLRLMESVDLQPEEVEALVRSHHFKDFKARGFVLGPVSRACNIFLGAHLGRWVDGYLQE